MTDWRTYQFLVVSFIFSLMLVLLPLGPVARAAAFTVPNPYATDTAEFSIPRLIVFGDSYSSVNTVLPFWKWSTQLYYDTGQARAMVNMAGGGSTGGNYGSPTNDTFGAQVGRLSATPQDGDLTVVYFGYNDMTRSVISSSWPGIAKPLADYRAALQQLIRAGYASGNRRVLLILPHDWSRVPRFTGVDKRLAPAVHRNILQWNAGVAKLAQDNAAVGVVAVDLFTAMECVFRQPSAFGFVNVTDMRTDATANPDQWLYNYKDRYHFSEHGQRLIRQVIEYYLTKGWDWANVYKDPATAQQKFVAELRAGNVFPVQCTSLADPTGSVPDNFDALEYIASYPDLISAFGANPDAGLAHYLQYGRYEGRAITFDGLQYIASYDDLIRAFGPNRDAGAAHFITSGAAEGRVQDDFNDTQYLINYPDLQAAFGSEIEAATIHYIKYGYFENRTDDPLSATSGP